MNEEYKWWRCSDCGNEVLSIRYPTLIKWSDGHVCKYKDVTEEFKKEMPDYVEEMRKIK